MWPRGVIHKEDLDIAEEYILLNDKIWRDVEELEELSVTYGYVNYQRYPGWLNDPPEREPDSTTRIVDDDMGVEDIHGDQGVEEGPLDALWICDDGA